MEINQSNLERKSPLELAKETFIFAAKALSRFQNGTLDDKHLVLRDLGSNFFLKDRKLIIQAEKPYHIIERGLQHYDDENPSLEPENNGSKSNDIERRTPDFESWCTTVEDVRTFYESLPESEISVSSF